MRYSGITADWSIRCGSRLALQRPPSSYLPRSSAHEHVAAECKAVRESVGMLEISTTAVRGNPPAAPVPSHDPTR